MLMNMGDHPILYLNHKPKQCLYFLFLTKCYIIDVECLRYWATQTLDNAENILYIYHQFKTYTKYLLYNCTMYIFMVLFHLMCDLFLDFSQGKNNIIE